MLYIVCLIVDRKLLRLGPSAGVLAVVVTADSGSTSAVPSSRVALVLTQECVSVFDVDSDTRLRWFAVADVDCQLKRSADATSLFFCSHVAAMVLVSLIFFYLPPTFWIL